MDEKRIKVYNIQKFNVGIKTLDSPHGINIAPGSFCMLTETDIEYLNSISNIFRNGILKVDKTAEERMEAIKEDLYESPNLVEDEEIKKNLGLSAKKMGEWLDTITEPFVLDRIATIAKEMNLNMSKLKVLSEKMPDVNFME